MTAPENPPKLWALTVRVGSPRFSELQTFAHPDPADAREQHACVEDKDQVSPVAEYVLASTAAAEREAAVKAAREKFADLIEKADDLADDLVGRPRSSEVTEALRRERDALLVERDRLARLGWAAVTIIRGMSHVSTARFYWGEDEAAKKDGDMASSMMNRALAEQEDRLADLCDEVSKAVLEEDDKAAQAGKGVG